jgi:CheY-like chemotaxis protein
MTMNMIAPSAWSPGSHLYNSMTSPSQGVVVLVCDDPIMLQGLSSVCEFLDLRAEVVSGEQDLSRALSECRPIAVIGDVEGREMDGFHTMKVVARNNRDLPFMLLTGGSAVMMGAADAVQDFWGLTNVTVSSALPMAGQLVAFLFAAGRQSGRMRLVPV